MQKYFSSLLSFAVITVGLLVTIFPFTSGEDAYFVNDSYYINLKDSVDEGYVPFLKTLVQKERSNFGHLEKKTFREAIKFEADSLEGEQQAALDKNKNEKAEQISFMLSDIRKQIFEKENAIDAKYDVAKLSTKEYQILFEKVKKSTSQLQYVTAVANEVTNSSEKNRIQEKEIQIISVNKQSITPFIIAGLFIILCGVLLFLFQNEQVKLHAQNRSKIISGGLILLSLIMTFQIYSTFANQLKFDAELQSREVIVKQRLNDIRAIQLSYYESKNKYCKNWEELEKFVLTDSIKIIKYLVNKDDTAAVNSALKAGLPIEEEIRVSVMKKTFGTKKPSLANLALVPFSKDQFILNAGTIDNNGRKIPVFEVKTTKYNFVKNLSILPENFDKISFLSVGSMEDPSTEGNW